MSPMDCPIPEVAEALGSFIRPRHEVEAIRRNLQAHLQTQLATDDNRLSSVRLHEPDSLDVSESPSGISGVRKAYWKALQAHSAAQARFNALKAELQQARTSDVVPGAPANPGVDSVNDRHIPILRQREKQRRLRAIDRAFGEISSAGGRSTASSLDDVVRRQKGEVPIPHAAENNQFRAVPDVESRILQLKKVVLSAQRGVQQREMMPSQKAPESAHDPVTAEVTGLQKALNELTGWMETQLALIGDSEKDLRPSPVATPPNGHGPSAPASLPEIEDLYEDYLAARRKLIHIVNHPPAADRPTSPLFPSHGRSTARETEKRATPSETLLPHVASLVGAKAEEQALLQQTAHLRRQISGAEADKDGLIARLADESHLVPPGAARGRHWADAAAEVGKETHAFVRQRLQAGEAAANAAEQTLNDISRVPDILENL